MPLQNRVTPFGDLFATPAKSSFMGNRGILHNEQGELTVKCWTHKSWVICSLNFKNYRRYPQKRTPGNYTELFFWDEATALAAGHRPCAQCRHKDFIRFVECWTKGNDISPETPVKEIDKRLHSDRVNRLRQKMVYTLPIDELPDGVFIELDEEPETAWLIWNGELLKWLPEGYSCRRAKPNGIMVTVLTPLSTVNAICAGYIPQVRQEPKSSWQTILKVGCEGGCITLQGNNLSNGWEFRMTTDESSQAGIINEEDLPGAITSESYVVSTWEGALKLLERYPHWPTLYPMEVHPEFANEIIGAVSEKSDSPDFVAHCGYVDLGSWNRHLMADQSYN